ncbi:PTS sugar transporter subunit IIC [Streptococcus merionis]|uniref:Permease IIC component n=1 Tax=Streptococcus merionis TaxID=400065 RepID=A0A239SY42_9STRE|nr:PTS transporter subunit EIIC [Streptococcus merionis]SNU89748.1 PTS system sugar transporter subunit IIC [Streptococcus merionis]
MGFFDKYSEVVGDIAVAIDDNKYLAAIKNTFTIYMPFVIVGSFSTLFKVLLSSTTTGLAQFSGFGWLVSLEPAFNAMNYATMNIMSLAIPVILGAMLARQNKVNELFAAIVALSSYVAVVPQSIKATVDGAEAVLAALPVASTNASGLFIGMVVAIISVEIFSKLSKIEKLQIQMPPSVPAGITKSFNVMLPIFIVIVTFSLLGTIFYNLTGTYINEFIYKILQGPLETIAQTPAGIIILIVISQLFWLVGIHGGLIITPIRNPLLIAALAANIEAFTASNAPQNPVTLGFWNVFVATGGAGYTLSLIIALLFFSKKDDSREIAKISFAPGIFGISEPIVFGLPLVLNPIYAIPFVFVSAINSGVALLFFQMGFLTPNTIDIPFGLPLFLNAFIGYGWQGAVVQALLIALGVIMYAPFVLSANRMKEE